MKRSTDYTEDTDFKDREREERPRPGVFICIFNLCPLCNLCNLWINSSHQLNRTRCYPGNWRRGTLAAVRLNLRRFAMSSRALAVCALLFVSATAQAAEPKPLWELDAASGETGAAPGWVSFSPSGKAVVAVMVRETPERQEFTYKLRVWDSGTRKERFNADLGRGRTPAWGDELGSFPTDGTLLTGGQSL